MKSVGIDIRNIALSFGSTRVLRDITLRVEPGEFFALLGPSGSGKSTLLRLIAGFNQHQSGELLVDGKDVTGTPPWLRNVGMVFQSFNLFPHLTALENVIKAPMVVRKMPRAEAEEKACVYLEKVGLGNRMNHYPSQLSGGQQQRAAIARALTMSPKVMARRSLLAASASTSPSTCVSMSLACCAVSRFVPVRPGCPGVPSGYTSAGTGHVRKRFTRSSILVVIVGP